MFWNFFGKNRQYATVCETDGNVQKKNRLVIILIIAAICILAFSNGGRDKAEKERVVSETGKAEFNIENYTENTEKRLREILSGIKGAGVVRVMVTFENLGEKIPAKNSKNERISDSNGEKNVSSTASEEDIQIFGAGNDEQLFILREQLPIPSGVLVIATGASDETVRLEIYEAVRALFGVSGHRIKVACAENV